jgi:hypothetical protein
MKSTNSMQTNYEDDLQSSIANLYACFSSYELREKMDACTCGCISPEDISVLYSKPLRDLGEEELEKYSRKALSTWGNTYDFRHFLPRLFELSANESYTMTEMEILFSKLKYGDWETWDKKEQEVISGYFSALWKNFLATKPEEYSHAESYICAFSQALDNPYLFLEIWENMDDELAYEHLKLFIEWNKDDLARHELSNAFWERRQTQMNYVIDWLLSSKTTENLKRKVNQSMGIKKELITDILHQLEKYNAN